MECFFIVWVTWETTSAPAPFANSESSERESFNPHTSLLFFVRTPTNSARSFRRLTSMVFLEIKNPPC